MILGVQRSVSIDQAGLRDVTAPFFSHAWEQRKLGELENDGRIRLGRGHVISAKDVQQCPGQYPIYSASAKHGGEMGQYGHYMFDQELVTWSIDGGGSVFYRPKHKYSVTNVCGFIDANSSIDTAFLAYQMGLRHSRLHFDYTVKAHPSVIRNLYNIGIPSLPEQRCISSLFGQLDNLITLHQRKLSHLRELKRGLLQKMFPKSGEDRPEVRFPGFADAWEQRKLSNCCTITGGNAWKSSDYSSTGDYLVVTIANVQGQKYINDKVGNRISVVNPGKYLLKQEDMLVSLTGNVGRVSRMTDTPAVLNQRVGLIKPKTNEVSDEFLFQVLSNNAFESSMVARGQGAAQANISNNDVLSYELLVPKDVREQTSVARLFRYFDTTIALHQRKQLNI